MMIIAVIIVLLKNLVQDLLTTFSNPSMLCWCFSKISMTVDHLDKSLDYWSKSS